MVEVLGYGGAVPAVATFAAYFLLTVVLPRTMAGRFRAAGAVAAGVLCGYCLLPWAELLPTRHWHWLPWLPLGAAITSVSLAPDVGVLERGLGQVAFSLFCAWLLVPTWESLEPGREFYVPALAGYIFVLWVGLETLARRSNATMVPWLALSAVASAAMVSVFVTMKYGQVAGLGAAALAGAAIATAIKRETVDIRSVIPAYCAIAVGGAFVGYIDPEPPRTALMIPPLAPLMLWCCAFGPLSKWRGVKGLAVRAVLVITPLAGTGYWLYDQAGGLSL